MSPNPSPYAPPRAPVAATGTVDAKKTEPLPLVCVKCASTHETTRVPKTLIVVARARIVTLLIAVMGGVTVALVREPNVRVYGFGGVALVALVVRRFVYSRVDLDVPLCASCAHRWASGVRWSKILRAMVFLLALGTTITTLAQLSPLLTIVLGLGVFAAAIGLALLRMRTRIVVAQKVAGDVVTLALVHPDAVAAISSARS
jgi:hypothetical protein